MGTFDSLIELTIKAAVEAKAAIDKDFNSATSEVIMNRFFILLFTTLVLQIPTIALAEPEPEKITSSISCSDEAELIKNFSAFTTMRTDYREEKTIFLMSEPLVSEGKIHYLKPDKIHQTIEKPTRQTVIISKDTLKIIQNDLHREQTMDLSSNEAAKMIVQNILMIMSGQIDALSETYQCSLRKEEDHFVLTLLPQQEPMNKMIQSITVEVNNPELIITRFTIKEVGGDTSQMIFSNTVVDKPYSDQELSDFFTFTPQK